jgi:hypothetical protein
VPGLDGNGAVLAETTWDPDGAGPQPPLLVVSGNFWTAGDATAIGIAAWDGQTWRALGNSTGGEIWGVQALAVFNGELIAGGSFSTTFGSPANFVARFDVPTGTWQPLGAGTDQAVRALTVYNGELVAAGFFTTAGGQPANHVARWNGTTWAPVGPGLPSTMVALTVHDGNLIAAGSGVFRWNGVDWQQLGPSMSVETLAIHNGEIVAGGVFRIADGGPANHIAHWDGLAWQPFGSGMNDVVKAITTYDGELIAGGFFTTAGGGAVPHLARWNGSAWSSLAGGGGRTVWALTVYNGSLILGGTETRASGELATRVMRWDGIGWNTLGTGMNSVVTAVADYQGYLYAGGGFTTARGVADARGLVRRSGTSPATPWEPVGTGLGGDFPVVTQMAVYSGSLIVVGSFTSAGGVPVNGIASWDGAAWHSFATNGAGALIVFNGELYTTGPFPPSRVGRLVGNTWQAVGSMPNNFGATCLTVYNGELIAGGFAGSGAPSSVYRWDGATWHEMGPPMGEMVNAVEVYNGELYAGGLFTTTTGAAGDGIVRWTGSAWVPLGGLRAQVYDLMPYQGELIVAGLFIQDFGSPVRNIARWNGTKWGELGQGIGLEGATIDDPALALTTFNDELIVGGWFTVADGTANGYWAHWGCGATTAVPVVPTAAGLNLSGPWPHPARDHFTVSFSLPSAVPASLELLDLAGRLVERRDVGSLGPGSHQITLGGSRRLSPGVYLVRLSQGAESTSAKAVLLP